MDFNTIAIPFLAVFVTVLVTAEIVKKRTLIFIFKPISTLLVIAVGLVGVLGGASPSPYGLLVLGGLLLSFGGDMALMWPDNPGRFRLGLVLFLSAHVAYTAAFWQHGGWLTADWMVVAGLLIFGVSFFLLLKSGLGKMKGPVIAYIVIISVMLSRALSPSFVVAFNSRAAAFMGIGAASFFISDVILAGSRFWKPWKYNRISLAFYYTGQLCIALSVTGL